MIVFVVKLNILFCTVILRNPNLTTEAGQGCYNLFAHFFLSLFTNTFGHHNYFILPLHLHQLPPLHHHITTITPSPFPLSPSFATTAPPLDLHHRCHYTTAITAHFLLFVSSFHSFGCNQIYFTLLSFHFTSLTETLSSFSSHL